MLAFVWAQAQAAPEAAEQEYAQRAAEDVRARREERQRTWWASGHLALRAEFDGKRKADPVATADRFGRLRRLGAAR
jgi:hypothetical protein